MLQIYISLLLGRAIAQALASHRGCPGSSPGLVMWDLWWTKWRWGRFSQSTSAYPDNLHYTNFSTITIAYHLGLVQWTVVAAVSRDLVSLTPLRIKKTYYYIGGGGARGSVVGWGTMLQAGRSRDRVPMRWILLIDLTLPAALWLWCRLRL
jgi:hypothetical protein